MFRWLVPASALGLVVIVAAHAQQPAATDAPKTVVSTVRLENGIRTSKLLGASVFERRTSISATFPTSISVSKARSPASSFRLAAS
jgi:hypothetical protein